VGGPRDEKTAQACVGVAHPSCISVARVVQVQHGGARAGTRAKSRDASSQGKEAEPRVQAGVYVDRSPGPVVASWFNSKGEMKTSQSESAMDGWMDGSRVPSVERMRQSITMHPDVSFAMD
jgi:hypothetical protein